MPLTPKQQPPYYGTEDLPTPAVTPKIYKATLTQSGTNAPVPTIMINTIGTIVWSRAATGVYLATLTGAFTIDKTFILYGKGQNSGYLITAAPDTINNIYISTRNLSQVDQDDWMLQTPIQIEIYT